MKDNKTKERQTEKMNKEKMIKFTDLDLSNYLTITKEKVSKEELEKIETSKIKVDENEVFRLMQIADGSHADDWKGTKEKTEETKEKTEETKEKTEGTKEKTEGTKEKTEGTKEKTEGTIRLINKVQEKIKTEDAEYRKSANMDFPYIAASIVTKAELTLYHFMDANLCNRDNIVILTKVRLGDLINLDTRLTNDKSYYWKVACKHVDYVICRKDNMKVLCVVELDDYTHETKEAQEKDMFIMQALKTAGIDTVRIKTRIASISKADLEMIDEYINKEFAPKCPACGLPMVPKKCMRGYRKGHRFYACLNNVSCRYTINID